MPRSVRSSRRAVVALGVAFALLLTGCSDPAYLGDGSWKDQLDQSNPYVAPQPEEGKGGSSSPESPGQPGAGAKDPNVVATKMNQPWGIAPLPDGTALVGERTTGKIYKVFPDPDKPKQELLTIPGIDASGDGGLLGLSLSLTYAEDGLIYAYTTTATDNRIISFTLTGGGPVTVFAGIPRGETHNGGALAVGPDGNLYIGTGDTGNPDLATDPKSLAGKVLRITEFGEPVDGETTPVVGRGLHNATGLCIGDQAGYVVDAGSGTVGSPKDDGLYPLGKDADYTTISPAVDYAPDTGAAGCVAIATSAVVTTLDAQALLTSLVNTEGKAVAEPEKVLQKKYGRLRNTALDPASGKLWVTTSNKDGAGKPIADDDRVLLIPPPAGAGSGGVT